VHAASLPSSRALLVAGWLLCLYEELILSTPVRCVIVDHFELIRAVSMSLQHPRARRIRQPAGAVHFSYLLIGCATHASLLPIWCLSLACGDVLLRW
jgi:hypothetical protein